MPQARRVGSRIGVETAFLPMDAGTALRCVPESEIVDALFVWSACAR